MTFKDLADAIHLRNHVLRQLDLAEADPRNASRYLTFVFVGAGYAGVEALAEMRQLVEDAVRHYPALRDVPQRWVLVDAGPGILAEVPRRLADHTTAQLRRHGVEILTSSTVASVEARAVTLADGTAPRHRDPGVDGRGRRRTRWSATLGLPLDQRGRIRRRLLPAGRAGARTSGPSGTAPPYRTPPRPDRLDPPTCQHAVRQARAVAASLEGATGPYAYRSIGEGATLGRGQGVARVFRLHVRGRLGALITRAYHIQCGATALPTAAHPHRRPAVDAPSGATSPRTPSPTAPSSRAPASTAATPGRTSPPAAPGSSRSPCGRCRPPCPRGRRRPRRWRGSAG